MPDLLFKNSIAALGKHLFLKYTVEAGESWDHVKIIYRSDSLFITGDTVSITCISVNEQLKTLQGTFNCNVYNYKRTYSGIIEDIYLFFAENTGYVGQIVKLNGIVRYKKLLLSNNILSML